MSVHGVSAPTAYAGGGPTKNTHTHTWNGRYGGERNKKNRWNWIMFQYKWLFRAIELDSDMISFHCHERICMCALIGYGSIVSRCKPLNFDLLCVSYSSPYWLAVEWQQRQMARGGNSIRQRSLDRVFLVLLLYLFLPLHNVWSSSMWIYDSNT